MATLEHIMFVGGPLDGEVREGAFGDRIYLDAALNIVQPAIAQDGPTNTFQRQHRYKRSLPTYEFDYEGYS